MIPTGISAAVPTGPNSHAMPTNPSSSPPRRTSRLRGFSYLRHTTGHHHHSHSPAAPVVTTSIASAATQMLPGSTNTGGRRPSAADQIARGTSTTATSVTIPASTASVNGLTRVVSHPLTETVTTATNGRFPVVANSPNNGNNASTSGIRPRSDSLPPLTQVRSIDEALAPQPNSNVSTPAVRAPEVPGTSTKARARPSGDTPPASIRFTPHIDIRASREALTFSPIERVLRAGNEVIRVGRYSERDNQPSARDPSGSNTAPVGFKSKVVSRRHCEFWYDKGQWFVKDVKSSSGTFLNHIRLSAPGVESRAFPLYDGDVLQLGIDFKGGEEPIFRCVKIRVELNRAWQKGLNNFNMSAHKHLRNMAANSLPQGDTASTHTSECSICLMSVAPCQALFVAPCSHVWHYKCIRPLVEKAYPLFLCPNCRAIADLERDIDEDELEIFKAANSNQNENEASVDVDENNAGTVGTAMPRDSVYDHEQNDEGEDDPEDIEGAGSAVGDAPTEIGVPGRGLGDETAILTVVEGLDLLQLPHCTRRRNQQTDNDSINSRSSGENGYLRGRDAEDASDDSGRDGTSGHRGGAGGGPMTPRNDIGPFVFDGVARGRIRGGEDPLLES